MKIQPFITGALAENCYVLTDEQTGQSAVIDPGELTERLADFLEENGLKNVVYILLTHGHFDHIMGVAQVKEKTGAQVVIHALDEPCLADEEKSLASREYPGVQMPVQADRLVADGDVLELGSLRIQVLHTPGHTRGGVCYVCENAVFSGDTLFCHTCGRTDFPGGSMEQMRDSLQRLAELPGDYNVYPGHNRATTLEEERVKNRYMRKLV